MKKVICVLVSAIMAVALAGCSYVVATNENGGVSITPSSTEKGAVQNAEEAAEVPALESVYEVSHNVDEITIPGRDYLIVVNENNGYDFDGEYNKNLQKDLVFMVNAVDGDVMAVEKATYLAFTMLQRDLRENDGIEIALFDGYRTAEDQKFLQGLYEQGSPLITKAAEPGFSEHHTGLLLDVVVWMSEDDKNYEWYSASPERWDEIPEFKTIRKKMTDYGFIERYPDDKIDITKVAGKSFEIRFVGSSEIAHKIMDEGLCLEEYVGLDK